LAFDPTHNLTMENQTLPSNRPTFLTIICIISFVGIGYFIIQSLIALALSSAGTSLYSIVKENLEMGLHGAGNKNPASAAFLEHILNALLRLIEVLPIFSGLLILSCMIAFAGVLFMWNLKKTGFYLFIIAKFILVFLPVLLIGFNLVSVVMSIPIFISSAIFITLYSLNFKALK
jgi:hypothetical protein